jgi:hypothetical protein
MFSGLFQKLFGSRDGNNMIHISHAELATLITGCRYIDDMGRLDQIQEFLAPSDQSHFAPFGYCRTLRSRIPLALEEQFRDVADFVQRCESEIKNIGVTNNYDTKVCEQQLNQLIARAVGRRNNVVQRDLLTYRQ